MAIAPSRLRARHKTDHRPSRVRRAQKRTSYNEDSNDEEEHCREVSEDEEEALPSMARPLPVPKRRRRAAHSAPTTRSKHIAMQKRSKKSAGRPRRMSAMPKKMNAKKSRTDIPATGPHIRMVGKQMPWQTLPFQILTLILAHAAGPLVSSTNQALPSVKWLLRMVTLCKDFTEPALSVLYFCPPIVLPSQISKLGELLGRETEDASIKYRHKIRYLELQLTHTGTRGLQKGFALADIVRLAPRIRGMHLGPPENDPKRFPTGFSKTNGPEIPSVVRAIIEAESPLEEWSWNGSFEENRPLLSTVKEIHSLHPFCKLRSLTFSNLLERQTPPLSDPNANERLETTLASIINKIPTLKQLRLSVVSVYGGLLLPLLPDTLESLVILNCVDVQSHDLQEFITTKGHHLKELILSHNAALNLSFLTELSWACPKLETLIMDFLYFNTFFTSCDSDPRYDSLLLDDEQATWPSSLRHLELLYLRNWSTKVAEKFFRSLTEHAQSLPNLRCLKIKASLPESGWRDRIAFRDKWVSDLERIFLRQANSRDSRVHPKVIIPHKSRDSPVKNSDQDLMELDSDSNSNSDVPLTKTRRSDRLKAVSFDDESATRSSQPSRTLTQSGQIRRRNAMNDDSDSDSEMDDSDVFDSSTPSGPRSSKAAQSNHADHETLPVQGMCDIVDIVVDNLRPTEDQLHESDFLDEELSGDEDWNAKDDDIHAYQRPGYAW